MTQFYTLEQVSSADSLAYISLSAHVPITKYLEVSEAQVQGILSAE